MALLMSPIPKKARQANQVPGIFLPNAFTSAFMINAANPTRANTIVNGGSAASWTAAKKNEGPPPQD